MAHRRLPAGSGATRPDDFLCLSHNDVPVRQDLKSKPSVLRSKGFDLRVDRGDAHEGGRRTSRRGCARVVDGQTDHVVVAVVNRPARKHVARKVAGLVSLRK